MDRCRDEILAVAANLAARSADGTFSPDDVVRELARQGSSYQESTIRTYVTSVMCADAPVHHQNHTNDLRRVGRAHYALIDPLPRTITRPTTFSTTVVAEEPLPAPELAAGDSVEQREAEVEAIRLLADRLDTPLVPERLKLMDGSVVIVDGVSHDPAILVETWAHQGPPKTAQKHKVLSDALKLTFVAAALGAQHRRVYRKMLCFSDEQAAAPFRRSSWQAGALAHHGIEIAVVELGPEWRQRIGEAQKRQAR
jgi:hypothetical protein